MDFQEIKDNARKELEKALAEKEEIIKQLQQKLDGIERFKIGNIVIGRGDNYLIVGEPKIVGSYLNLPIRHHVYPQYSLKSVSMNFSGVIDNLKIPVGEMDNAQVVTIKEFFAMKKDNLRELFEDDHKNIKRKIKQLEDEIKQKKKNIKLYQESDKEYSEADFDGTYDEFVEKYLKSDDIAKYVYSVNAEDYIDRGQIDIDFTTPVFCTNPHYV